MIGKEQLYLYVVLGTTSFSVRGLHTGQLSWFDSGWPVWPRFFILTLQYISMFVEIHLIAFSSFYYVY